MKRDNWLELIKKEDRLLDVGCWKGDKVKELIKKCNAYGIDINQKRLNEAQREIRKRLYCIDITKKKLFSKKKFDWILIEEVIEHIKEDQKALNNIKKLLKKDGRIILSTPKKVIGFDFWDPAWIKWKLGGNERHYHYTKGELIKKLKKANLQVIDYEICGNIKWLLFRWINIFLKYGIRTKKQFTTNMKKGYFDWSFLLK